MECEGGGAVVNDNKYSMIPLVRTFRGGGGGGGFDSKFKSCFKYYRLAIHGWVGGGGLVHEYFDNFCHIYLTHFRREPRLLAPICVAWMVYTGGGMIDP